MVHHTTSTCTLANSREINGMYSWFSTVVYSTQPHQHHQTPSQAPPHHCPQCHQPVDIHGSHCRSHCWTNSLCLQHWLDPPLHAACGIIVKCPNSNTWDALTCHCCWVPSRYCWICHDPLFEHQIFWGVWDADHKLAYIHFLKSWYPHIRPHTIHQYSIQPAANNITTWSQ